MSTAPNAPHSQTELSGYKAVNSIGAILKETESQWRGIIQSPAVTLTCFIAPELHDVELDNPMPLQQGLTALLGNAHQLTSTGRIHIHATITPAISAQQRPSISIIIADTGAGIAPASMNALFQNERPLAPLRSWAKENKGDLSAISNLGRGSEFSLSFEPPAIRAAVAPIETELAEPEQARYLPIDLGLEDEPSPLDASAGQASLARPKQTPPSPLSGARILIVEDQISNQNVIKLLLDSEDCHCICANNGPRALSILDTQKVDFILMDILMPGTSGIETTHAIRQSGKDYAHTPIIALTADLNPENNAACMAAGANIFLTKPVLAKNLIEALKFLERTGMGTARTLEPQNTIAA